MLYLQGSINVTAIVIGQKVTSMVGIQLFRGVLACKHRHCRGVFLHKFIVYARVYLPLLSLRSHHPKKQQQTGVYDPFNLQSFTTGRYEISTLNLLSSCTTEDSEFNGQIFVIIYWSTQSTGDFALRKHRSSLLQD